MPSVFHYTDASGLLGILRSNSLFATDYRYLNDTSEAAAIRSLLLPIFEAEIASIAPKLVEKGWLKKGFYDDYGTSAHQQQAEKLYEALARATDNIIPFFVLSFCRHHDKSQSFKHGLLSQWRGYSDGGGFAIQFNEEKLDALMKFEHEKFAYVVTKQDKVLYENFDAVFKPEIYAGIAGEMIRRLFESKIDISEVTGTKNIDEIMFSFISTAPFMKHWGFREESEYRILAACNRPNRIPQGEDRLPKEIKFRTRNSFVIPYIELFGTLQQVLPIEAIVVGPHPQQEIQAEAVEMMLESIKLSAEVRMSEIPYRR